MPTEKIEWLHKCLINLRSINVKKLNQSEATDVQRPNHMETSLLICSAY